MNKILCKFHWDCGRMGSLSGLFVTTQKKLDKAITCGIDFGEVLGKHSNIYGPLEPGDISVLCDDQEFIERAEKLGVVPLGYNPLDYLVWNEDTEKWEKE